STGNAASDRLFPVSRGRSWHGFFPIVTIATRKVPTSCRFSWRRCIMSKSAPLLSAKDLKNPHKLDRSFVDSLVSHVSQVNAEDADLARRLIRFVVDGTDSQVVLELGGRSSIGTSLRLHRSFLANNDQAWRLTQKKSREREQFLWPKVEVPPEVWMRLG